MPREHCSDEHYGNTRYVWITTLRDCGADPTGLNHQFLQVCVEDVSQPTEGAPESRLGNFEKVVPCQMIQCRSSILLRLSLQK